MSALFAGFGGASLTRPAAVVPAAVILGLGVLDLLLPRFAASLLGIGSLPLGPALWRPFTYGVTTYGLLGALVTGLFCFVVGRAVEESAGRTAYVGTYLAAGLGAAAAAAWLVPYSAGGATAALLGLLAADAVRKRRAGEEIKGDLILLALLVAFSLVGGSRDWLADLGGIAAGALCGQLVATAPWRAGERERVLRLRLGTVAAVGFVIAAAGLLL